MSSVTQYHFDPSLPGYKTFPVYADPWSRWSGRRLPKPKCQYHFLFPNPGLERSTAGVSLLHDLLYERIPTSLDQQVFKGMLPHAPRAQGLTL